MTSVFALRLSQRAASISGLILCLVAFAVAAEPALAVDRQASGGLGDELSDPGQRDSIEVGVRLERSRQWRDAIEHYGTALRQYPESRYLQYGLRRSKIQFDVDRRYSDPSFLNELSNLSADDALSMFEDVRRQIQGSFVEPISDTSLIAHGTESLWLGLANHRFLDRNLFGVDPVALARLRKRLHSEFWNYDVKRAGGARATIASVCRLAHQEVGLDPSVVVLEYVFGACNCLDDYSSVLTPGRLDDLYSNIDGEFVGIGIVMESKTGHGMKLINVLPDSPAAEAGIRPNEWIVAVDGTNVREMSTDESANLLTGLPGSRVNLQVEGRDGEVRPVSCVRRSVEVKSVPIAQMVDAAEGIGYIRLTGFQKSTPREMDAALAKLQAQGMRKLIWDVRGNPGGLLPAAVEVLDRFLERGVIVSTRGRASDQNFSYSATRGDDWHGEIVLLIDGGSASASEIVAGCLRDHDRGTIVGRKSYGKWSVQTIYPSPHDSGLRLTTAKFYSPNNHNYGRRTSYDVTGGGLKPDIVVGENEDDPITPGFDAVDPADPDVLKAVELLSEGPQFTQR